MCFELDGHAVGWGVFAFFIALLLIRAMEFDWRNGEQSQERKP